MFNLFKVALSLRQPEEYKMCTKMFGKTSQIEMIVKVLRKHYMLSHNSPTKSLRQCFCEIGVCKTSVHVPCNSKFKPYLPRLLHAINEMLQIIGMSGFYTFIMKMNIFQTSLLYLKKLLLNW
jgi:hypothetical protein